MKKGHVKQFLIIGRPNSGKTLFMLNFSEYMGYKSLNIRFRTPSSEFFKNDSIESFKRSIVGDIRYTTKCLQTASIEKPVFKAAKTVEFTDTTGLSSSIHYEPAVREGMAQTLMQLKDDNIILHMVDAGAVHNEKKLDSIDMEIYGYGRKRGNYLVLANKMDLKSFDYGYRIIYNAFSDVRIFKISSLYKTGFYDIKKWIFRSFTAFKLYDKIVR